MYSKLPYAFKGAAAGALALGALLAPTSASAVITIEGIDLPVGAVFKSSTIFENVVLNTGETLDGLGRINVIESGGSAVVWTTGDNGRELTFTFDNFLVERITQDLVNDTARIFFSGGNATFYSDTSQDFSTDNTVVADQAEAFDRASNGVEFLNLVAEQTKDLELTVATDFSGAGEAITLIADLELGAGGLGDITSGTNTVELSFLSVDTSGAGVANAFFDTNTFVNGTDIQLGSDFSTTNTEQTVFPLRGDANFNANVIPEPSALGLFGIGLIGLGFAARRRRQR